MECSKSALALMPRLHAIRLGLCLALAAPAGAADPLDAPGAGAAGLERLQPGQRIRVSATGQPAAEGAFVAIRDGRLQLASPGPAGPVVEIPVATVETVWVRTRATRKGALVGGIVGGLATAGLFALGAGAACDAGSDCGGSAAVGAVVGLAAGGAAGALVGALFGAGSAAWRVVYRAGPGPPLSLPAPGPPPAVPAPAPLPASIARERKASDAVGSAALHLGFDKAFDDLAPDGAAGGHLRWTAELGAVRPGLGIGWLGLGGRSVLTPAGVPLAYDESVFYAGPLVGFGKARGHVRPYAVAGLGFYRWRAFDPQVLDPQSGVEVATSTRDFLGGSLAGGVRIRASSALCFELEGSLHSNLSEVPKVAAGEPGRRLEVVSVTAGAVWRW